MLYAKIEAKHEDKNWSYILYELKDNDLELYIGKGQDGNREATIYLMNLDNALRFGEGVYKQYLDISMDVEDSSIGVRFKGIFLSLANMLKEELTEKEAKSREPSVVINYLGDGIYKSFIPRYWNERGFIGVKEVQEEYQTIKPLIGKDLDTICDSLFDMNFDEVVSRVQCKRLVDEDDFFNTSNIEELSLEGEEWFIVMTYSSWNEPNVEYKERAE